MKLRGIALSLYDDLDSEEATRYAETVRSGIYETLCTAHKNDAKRQFGVFISPKYHRKNEFGENFTKSFPVLAAKMRGFEGSLAAHLQDIEAEIVIYGLVPRLRKLCIPFVSIHDGGLSRTSDAVTVAEILKEEIAARVGFDAHIKVLKSSLPSQAKLSQPVSGGARTLQESS